MRSCASLFPLLLNLIFGKCGYRILKNFYRATKILKVCLITRRALERLKSLVSFRIPPHVLNLINTIPKIENDLVLGMVHVDRPE